MDPLLLLPNDRAFTFREALSRGVSRHQLVQLTARGYLRPLLRGLYAPWDLPLDPGARARAIALVIPRHAVATDETAAWLHGVDVFGPVPAGELPPLSFFLPGAHERSRTRGVSSGSRQVTVSDVARVYGVHATTPLRTAVDLSRLRRPTRAIAALDGLLRLGVFTIQDMLQELERFRGYRGIIQARTLVPMADGRSESPAESLLRYVWVLASDLPDPTPQLPVPHPFSSVPWRLDLAVEEFKYAVEYDGADFHRRTEQQERDAFRRAYLRETLHWHIDVLTKAEVFARNANPITIIRAGVLEAMRAAGLTWQQWRWPSA